MAGIKDGDEKYLVIFQPSGCRGYIPKGKTLKEASVALGVDLEGVCGEKAICGTCKVRIEEGYFEKYGIKSSRESLSPMGMTEKKFWAAYGLSDEHVVEEAIRMCAAGKSLLTPSNLYGIRSRLEKIV